MTHASQILIESAKRDPQQMLHISAVALALALEAVERQASFFLCARCLFVRNDPSAAVTIMNGYALCEDHFGFYDSRDITREGT